MDVRLQTIILIFIRITSFIVICPGLSFKSLPNIFKIGLSASITFLVYTTIPAVEVSGNMLVFFLLVLKEALFGLQLGFVTNIVLTAMEIAGQLIDFQSGFAMAAVFDPSMGIHASNYGRLYYWLAVCVFFILDMHHIVIEMMIKSFTYVPPGYMSFDGFNPEAILVIFTRVFELALNLAAPIIIVALVTDVILGVISRTVPQINVLMLGMPFKAGVTFFFTLISISVLLRSIGNIVLLIPDYMEGFISYVRQTL